MKGDFSRWSHDPKKRYAGVLMQQGRVMLDADWNENGAIQADARQSLIVDLIGPHAGPGPEPGFKIDKGSISEEGFEIGAGRYYAEGIPCINPDPVHYKGQPSLIGTTAEAILGGRGRFLVYLVAWERPVNAIEDQDIRDPALLGTDTTLRVKVEWQVNVVRTALTPAQAKDWSKFRGLFRQELPLLQAEHFAAEDVHASPGEVTIERRYQGAGNQLYRVEIHRGGTAVQPGGEPNQGSATWKWSRENGSVEFGIAGEPARILKLVRGGRDDDLSLQPDDLVEVTSVFRLRRNEPGEIIPVQDVDSSGMQVTLAREPTLEEVDADQAATYFLRRWDQTSAQTQLANAAPELIDGGIPVRSESRMPLEQGIEITFSSGPNITYEVGDYWLIPARAATGTILWPEDPPALLPIGIKRYYAPLACFEYQRGKVSDFQDLRRRIARLWEPCEPNHHRRRSR